MRGNLPPAVHSLAAAGSIPAYAGEPDNAGPMYQCGGVYPRVCGGTSLWQTLKSKLGGLSPRMRGNPDGIGCRGSPRRSIPAYAGEPTAVSGLRSAVAVYPRVCGGTSATGSVVASGKGLSPRMRGNRAQGRGKARARGSIPAYAGEPSPRRPAAGSGRVYPRVCGGTIGVQSRGPFKLGLSPRMRGNRNYLSGCPIRRRSIPAYAGEPRPA